MKELSTRNLVLIAVVAIALSMFSIFLSFGRPGITGAQTTDTEVGYVNVTVSELVDITVVRSQINFTDSATGVTKSSHVASHIAASACVTDGECGINISNVGNTEVNISITAGDASGNDADLWESSGDYPAYGNARYYLYNVTMDPRYTTDSTTAGYWNCSAGYENATLPLNESTWRAVPATAENAMICMLNFSGSGFSYWGQVDINITVPGDEPSGIKTAVLKFTATDATPAGFTPP